MNEKITVPPVIKDNRFKPAFPDNIESFPGIDPLFKTTTDFDYPELERLLGESKTLEATDREKLARVLWEIIAWAIASNAGVVNLKRVALRVVALAWIVNPALFDGLSLAEISRQAGLKNSVRLCEQSGEASRKFGLRSHAQSHANANWKPE